MRNALTILFLFWMVIDGHGQDNDSAVANVSVQKRVFYHQLGDRLIAVNIDQYGSERDLLCINLHDDETTSVMAATTLLSQRGGILMRIENNGERLIKFRQAGREFRFDPNRIFSRNGINKTLLANKRYSKAAANEVKAFANWLIRLISQQRTKWVLALHNNTEGNYSINDYRLGEEKQSDAKQLHINTAKDADDFVLTTDTKLYHHLVEDDFNVVLQNYATAEKDGSLSIYCQGKSIRYLNCETEHGEYDEFLAMIISVDRFIRH